MRKKLKKIPKYKNGGQFWQNTGEFARNAGLGYIDYTLGALGADNVIQDSAYKGTGANAIRTGSGVAGKVGKAVLPIALAPLGVPPQATMAAQATISGFNPEEEKQIIPQSPIQQPQTYNDPYNYFEEGGGTPLNLQNLIEVEGNELEVKNGKITKDFKKQPSHKKGGYKYPAKPGHVIIPVKLRNRYLEGDTKTRTSIEANLINNQIAKDSDLNTDASEVMDIFNSGGAYLKKSYKDGGSTSIHIKPSHRGKFKAAANRAGMEVQEYASNILANKDNFSSERVKQAVFARNASKWNRKHAEQAVPQYTHGGAVYPTPDTQLPGFYPTPMGNIDNSYYQYETWKDSPSLTSGFSNNTTIFPTNTKTPQTDPKNPSTNYEKYANQAMQFAPLAYNLTRGLQKPEVMNSEDFQNPYESQIKNLMSRRAVDFKPIEDEIRSNYNSSLSRIGAGNKSSGQVLSAGTVLAGSRANAIAKAKLAAQQANNVYRGEEANTIDSLGQQRARTKFTAYDRNLQSKSDKNAYLGQAANEAQRYSKASMYNKIAEKDLSTLYDDWMYSPEFQQYIYRTNTETKP